MPRISSSKSGTIKLPKAFLEQRRLSPEGDFWLDEDQGDLILRARRPDVHKLYLEPTTGCNLNCRTCIRNVWEDPAAMMSWASFERVLDSLDGLPALQRVVFTGFGEPLLHKRFLDMVEAVRKRDLAVSVGSNGLLLKPEIARELVRLGVDRLVISVDGVKPDTYAGVRGAVLAEVLGNIRKLNELKTEMASLSPALGIEFVAIKSNFDELVQLAGLARHLSAARVLVSNVLPYTEGMLQERLYGYDPQPTLQSASWPVTAGAWVMWGSLELPRMHWGAERRCRFVNDRAMVVGWDGGVAPCYALSHNYSYYAIDGRQKQVSRYVLGNVSQQSLAETWMSEDYVRFRSEVRGFHFPSCPNCDLRDTCDLRERNEACWGWNPSCSDCLWAQDIIRCP